MRTGTKEMMQALLPPYLCRLFRRARGGDGGDALLHPDGGVAGVQVRRL